MILNKNKQSKYIIFTIIILIFFSSIKLKANEAFYAKGHIIHDLKLNILWLRCSVGQVWNSKTSSCDGKAIKLKMDQIDEVIIQANNQLGGFWRLPTRKELENLVCMSCDKVKITISFFQIHHTNLFGQEKKITGQKLRDFTGQLTFLLDILLADFPAIFLTLLDLLVNVDFFFR